MKFLRNANLPHPIEKNKKNRKFLSCLHSVKPTSLWTVSKDACETLTSPEH